MDRASIDMNQVVRMTTTAGKILLYFYPDVAPTHVRNFLYLCSKNFYDGVGFHRIVDHFVIQAGMPRADWDERIDTLKGEFNTIPHEHGTLSAARTSDPNSATSQFFLVLERAYAQHLDNQYTVYGQAFAGLDAIDAVAANWSAKTAKMPDRQANATPSDDKILSTELLPRADFEDAITEFRKGLMAVG